MRSLKYLILLFPIFFAGCFCPTDFEKIKADFAKNRTSFDELSAMIRRDIGVNMNFTVSPDHIGDSLVRDYWKNGEIWTQKNNWDQKKSLDEVLRETGLTRERYSHYLFLLQKIGAQSVDYYTYDERKKGELRIVIATSGLGVSGSLTSIDLNDDRTIPPSDIQTSYAKKIVPIKEGWYITHDST